jgi:tetratricopeptide (TPR) repeat protein
VQAETQHETIKPQRDPQQVFISHAHEDTEFAHRLANDLRQNGWRVWIAPDTIQPGEKWVEAINRGLEESGVFVLVLTPKAIRSKWVRSETNTAIELEHEERIRFIPLSVEDCEAPKLWSAYQCILFANHYADGFQELLTVLSQQPKQQESLPAQPVKKTRKPNSRVSSSISGPTMAELLTKLKEAEIAHKWSVAVELGKQLSKLEPDNISAHLKTAAAYRAIAAESYNKGDFDHAIETLRQAIELSPDIADYFGLLGWCYYNKGEYDSAITHCQHALKLNPRSANLYHLRGSCYYAKGNYPHALADLSHAIRLEPRKSRYYDARGLVCFHNQLYEKAIKDFSQTIELDPKIAKYHFHRGATYHAVKDFDRALDDCNKAIQLAPANSSYYSSRGLIYERSGEKDKAIADYTQALKLNTKDATCYYRRGTIYADSGLGGRALDDLGWRLQSSHNRRPLSSPWRLYVTNNSATLSRGIKTAKLRGIAQHSTPYAPRSSSSPHTSASKA